MDDPEGTNRSLRGTRLDMASLDERAQKEALRKQEDLLLTQFKLNKCKVFSSYDFLWKFNIRLLTHLSINGCAGVTDDLAYYLPGQSPQLTYLDLSQSPELRMFGSRFAWLVAAFVEYPSLLDLKLNACRKLSEVTVRANNLNALEIQDNPALTYLCAESKNLKSINMDRSSGIPDSMLDDVSLRCPALESISCEECPQIKCANMRKHLPSLSLKTYLLLTEDSQQHLNTWARTSPLKLYFSNGYMSRHMARDLEHMPYLTAIDLTSMNIRDVAVRIVLSRPTLTSAFLMSSSVVQIDGDNGPLLLPSLKEMWVAGCPKLTGLNIKGPQLESLYVSLSPLLRDLHVESETLQKFELKSSPGVSDKALDLLAENCPRLTTVKCTECPQLKNPCLRTKAPQFSQDPFPVDVLKTIENRYDPEREVELHFSERNLDESMVVSLADLPQVTLLNLTGNRCLYRLGMPGFPMPICFDFLKTLYLNRCNLREVRLVAQYLKYLNLSDNPDLDVVNIESPYLETLYMALTGITLKDLRGFIRTFPKMKEVGVKDCKKIKSTAAFEEGTLDDSIVKTLKFANTIKSLTLTKFKIETDALQQLLGNPSLTHLRLIDTPLKKDDVQAIMMSQFLTSVYLMNCGIQDKGASVIIKGLKKNPLLNDIKLVDETVSRSFLGILDVLMVDRKK